MPIYGARNIEYVSSGTRTTINSTSFTEPSSSYRVTITPSTTSSGIKVTYFIPGNLNGSWASNTIYTFRAWREIGGGSRSYALTSAGGTNGSRNVIAGMTDRPHNGQDANDPTTTEFTVIDFPSTTSSCVYGFEYKRETGGGGTLYFGHSEGNTDNWGFDTDILIIAEEII
ncbi:MAG: hypothetical protein FJ333_10525 [Sphingomonadales bacterium]|nr:hypothetical protein [Sphingomonadales bacterium]